MSKPTPTGVKPPRTISEEKRGRWRRDDLSKRIPGSSVQDRRFKTRRLRAKIVAQPRASWDVNTELKIKAKGVSSIDLGLLVAAK